MQPYQQASAALREREEAPFRALKTAGKFALSGGAASIGAGIAGKVIPFLSKYIPESLAIKGLTKVDPRFGKFINKALNAGQSFDEVRDFIKEKYEGSDSEEEGQANENRNIIEQYDPELHIYLSQKLKEGMSPQEAGKKALGHGRFAKAVEKITKDHKTSWSNILENVYGNAQMANKNTQVQAQQPSTQVQQEGPISQSDAALIAALEKVAQLRGNK